MKEDRLQISNLMTCVLFNMVALSTWNTASAKTICYDAPLTQKSRNFCVTDYLGMPFSMAIQDYNDVNILYKNNCLVFKKTMNGYRLRKKTILPRPPEPTWLLENLTQRDSLGYIPSSNNRLYFKGVDTIYYHHNGTWKPYWNFQQNYKIDKRTYTTSFTIANNGCGIIIGGANALVEIFSPADHFFCAIASVPYDKIKTKYENFHEWKELGPAMNFVIGSQLYSYFPSNGRIFQIDIEKASVHEIYVPWHAWVGSLDSARGFWLNSNKQSLEQPVFPCSLGFMPYPTKNSIGIIGLMYNFPEGQYCSFEITNGLNDKFSPRYQTENELVCPIQFINDSGEFVSLDKIIDEFVAKS